MPRSPFDPCIPTKAAKVPARSAMQAGTTPKKRTSLNGRADQAASDARVTKASSSIAVSWVDADGCCEPAIARQIILTAIEAPPSTKNTDIVAAGLSLLLGPEGRARQQLDSAEVRKVGSTPLVIALLAPAGDDVETMVSTIAVVPRVRRSR